MTRHSKLHVDGKKSNTGCNRTHIPRKSSIFAKIVLNLTIWPISEALILGAGLSKYSAVQYQHDKATHKRQTVPGGV
jgi:hypothetical protein